MDTRKPFRTNRTSQEGKDGTHLGKLFDNTGRNLIICVPILTTRNINLIEDGKSLPLEHSRPSDVTQNDFITFAGRESPIDEFIDAVVKLPKSSSLHREYTML